MDSDDSDDFDGGPLPPSAPVPGTNIHPRSCTLLTHSHTPPDHIFVFEDAPWLGGTHDGFPTTTSVEEYIYLRLNGREEADLPIHERAALWQTTLTFGLLEAAMEIAIPVHFLLTQDLQGGGTVVTDRNLPLLLYDWGLRIKRYAEEHLDACRKWRERIDEVLKQAYVLLMTDVYHADNSVFRKAGLDDRTISKVVSAYMAIAEAVIAGRKMLFSVEDRVAPPLRGDGYSLSFILAPDAAGRYIKAMIERGWCPFVVNTLANSLIKLAYASNLSPTTREDGQDHSSCTDKACYLDNIDSTHYTNKHVPHTCTCQFLRPPLEGVLDALAGNRIPVVLPSDSHGLTVQFSTETPYVAISHVWADGLGSTTESGLPTCQVERIVALTRQLVPGGAFWMDSLCIPAVRDARKRAIGLMARTYSDAAVVLVLDAGLSRCSSTAPLEEKLARITSCGWLQRLWTLQEAMLAPRVVLQFIDGLVDLDDLVDTVLRILDVHLHPLLMKFAAGLERLSLLRKHPGTTLNLGTISRMICRRTTSRMSDETLAVAGLFGVDAFRLAELPAEERMRYVLLKMWKLPRGIVFHDTPKMQISGFGWAPSTMMHSDESEASKLDRDVEAICTPTGLIAEYWTIFLPEMHVEPGVAWTIHDSNGSPFCMVRELPSSGAGNSAFDCNAILLSVLQWPAERAIASGVAVLATEQDEMKLDPLTDSERVVCEYRSRVLLTGLGYSRDADDQSEIVEGESMFCAVRLM